MQSNADRDCLHVACTLTDMRNMLLDAVYKHQEIIKHTYLAESGSMPSQASACSSDVRRTGMRSCSLHTIFAEPVPSVEVSHFRLWCLARVARHC